MLIPFIPELVMSTDLLIFEHPSVLYFALSFYLKQCTVTARRRGLHDEPCQNLYRGDKVQIFDPQIVRHPLDLSSLTD